MDVVRKIENTKTDDQDRPLTDCTIAESGILQVDEIFDFGLDGDVEGCWLPKMYFYIIFDTFVYLGNDWPGLWVVSIVGKISIQL